jgi:demethylmenaquinone methyltransferase / 2-methoxy-6-polyprenyl-1,4-benzoquinol methylase
MARQAKRKAKQPSKAASTPLHITVGDALRLPCRDASFDVASIAFGIRNVDDPQAGVAEMKRVVKPGGRVVVLEFGQPRGPLGVLYRWYSRHVMPRMGGWLTGDRAAYEYLPETASRFPSGDAFVAIMAAAGLHDIKSKRLTGGIAWLYVGTA